MALRPFAGVAIIRGVIVVVIAPDVDLVSRWFQCNFFGGEIFKVGASGRLPRLLR